MAPVRVFAHGPIKWPHSNSTRSPACRSCWHGTDPTSHLHRQQAFVTRSLWVRSPGTAKLMSPAQGLSGLQPPLKAQMAEGSSRAYSWACWWVSVPQRRLDRERQFLAIGRKSPSVFDHVGPLVAQLTAWRLAALEVRGSQDGSQSLFVAQSQKGYPIAWAIFCALQQLSWLHAH